MRRFSLAFARRPGRLVPAAALLLAALAAAGCAKARGGDGFVQPAPPYQRKIVLVVEGPDFRPLAGAQVTIETEGPTRLLVPAGGRGRTGAQGEIELVFEPLPHYDRTAWAGNDTIVDFPVRARLLIRGPGGRVAERFLDDRESFARYADPLYQGLDRDPEPSATYYTVSVPR